MSNPESPKSGSAWGRRILYLLLAVAFGLAMLGIGYLAGSWQQPGHEQATSASSEQQAPQPEARHIRYWTCVMHPQIKAPEKGHCPICSMELVPVYESATEQEGSGSQLVLSKAASELALIETSPVAYRPLTVTVRMVGKIDYDEVRLADVSAWVPGRIDRLYVDYVGMRVAKGDHLLYLYSPELRTAQEEFLIALRRLRAAESAANADEKVAALADKQAVQKKLELWGIMPDQIKQLELSGRSDDHMTIYAPMGGTVITRDAFQGKYVQAGERLFAIADLGSVWALLDAYEIDLGWLRYGQGVEFETDALPGEVFRGQIVFIPPFLNETTRTVKVRVNMPNPGERLKPGMFVRAKLDVALDEAARVKLPDMTGKWMCPMHPSVVKAGPADCDICGMKLVEASALGFVPLPATDKKALSIPDSAPLLTGKRAVVYVEERKGEQVSYTGREVTLGPRAGDYYIVLSGVSEGERVVTRGAFKIDATMQIQARPSMMNLEGGGER